MREWFVSQIFIKYLHICLWLIETSIDSINKKIVENDYQNNSGTQEKYQSKNKSTIEISKYVTEESRTNLIVSITSTTENFHQDKIVCRINETSNIINTVKEYTTGKQIIWKKTFLLFQRSKIDSSNRSIRS